MLFKVSAKTLMRTIFAKLQRKQRQMRALGKTQGQSMRARNASGRTEIDSGDWDLLRDVDDVAQYDLKPRIGLGACERESERTC